MDKVQIYQELERRGELGKLPPEKQAIWAEYKRRQEKPKYSQADFSSKFNTSLTPDEEGRYQEWLKTEGRKDDVYDYDTRGFWKEMSNGGLGVASNGHLSDKYKKPNHPTYSNESIYKLDGYTPGYWSKNSNGSFVFHAPSDMEQAKKDWLVQYFKENEQGNNLLFDKHNALTPGQRAWEGFKEDIADLTYAPRKALSGATLGASDWALRKLGVGYEDTEERYKQGWGNLGKYLGGDEEKWKAKAPRDLKILGFGAELGGNLLGGGKLLYDAIAKIGLKGLGLASATGVAEGGITGGFSEDGSSLQGMALGGLVPVGLSGLGHGIKYIAKKFTPSLMTQGMKGGLDNVVENPDAVKLMSQGLKRSDDIANDFLLQARPVARGINKDTANMVDSALTSRVDIPEAIRSANEKYGKYMDEHGADQIYDATVKTGNLINDNVDKIKNFHKTQDINFNKISSDDFKSLKPKKIHQSHDNFGKKGSEYFVAEKDGKLYYIRKSDHWGQFATNKKIDDFKAEYPEIWNKYKNLNITDGEEKFINDLVENKGLKLDTKDIYGRLDNKIHNWDLIGGKKQGATVNPKDFYLYEKSPLKYESLLKTGKLPDYYPDVRQIGMTEIPISQSNLPHINSLYEGLNPFQAKSLKGAIVRGGEKLEKGAKLGSVDHFNKIKQDINSQISDLVVRKGKEGDVRLLEILKSSVDNKAPKELKVVDKIYEKAKRLEDAFERGKHYNPNNVEGADYISELSPLERNAFTQGLFKRINNNSLTGKNLAETALDYENTLASVLSGDKYNDLMRGLNTQSTKFKRLAKLGNKAETKLGVPEADRLFAREQLESKGSLIGSAIDLGNTLLRGKSLKEASKLLLNPNYKGELGLVANILSSPADLSDYLYRINPSLGVGLNNTIFNNTVNQ